jgi:high-affinity Fe2+/Pb2+ permease
MPAPRFVIAFLVMFGGSAMSLCREFVLLSGFPVCVVHMLVSFLSSKGTRRAKLVRWKYLCGTH